MLQPITDGVVDDIQIVEVFDKRRFVDLERSGQSPNLLFIDPTRANVRVNKPTWHQQVRGEGVGSLLDARRCPLAAGMCNAPGPGAVEEHMAEFVRDRESPTGLIVVVGMRDVDDDARRETGACEGDSPNAVGFEGHAVDTNLETFANVPDIYGLVGVQHAEIFKKLGGEAITILMRDAQRFVAPLADKVRELAAILSAARFDKGIPQHRDIVTVKRRFDATEHGDGRRELLDAWNITERRAVVKEVQTIDLFE